MERPVTRPMPARPADNAQFAEKAAWLIRTHGFDARANRVVMLYEPSAHCTMTLDAFRTEYMHWYEMVQRQRGQPQRVQATSEWLSNPKRISIAGVRMHPGKGFPLYASDDTTEVFKNTYRRPEHADIAAGDVQPFLDFLQRFLPDKHERDHWLDWAAHKWMKPEIPGAALVYVADTEGGPLTGKYGTGRGFMDRIMHKLLGEAYCRSEDFEILTGQSGQADYTDWLANCVLVTIDEAQASPTAHRKGEKRSVYTALKKCIDPAPKRRTFRAKYGQTFEGLSFCSFTIATNHANVAAIPHNDRRLSVLRNGPEMTPPERAAIAAWIDAPGSIAALAEYLESSDLRAFDMYTPLKTVAKDDMVELSMNEVERALFDFAADDDRGLVFPRVFLEREVEAQLTGDSERIGGRDRSWQGQLAGAFDEHCEVLKLPSGKDKAKIMIGGRRYTLYCFRSRAAEAALMTETERREHVAKWGSVDSIQTVLREVKK